MDWVLMYDIYINININILYLKINVKYIWNCENNVWSVGWFYDFIISF